MLFTVTSTALHWDVYFFKGTQAWGNIDFFFYLNPNLIFPWSIFEKIFPSFSSIFARILMFEHFRGDWAYGEPDFFGELSKTYFIQNVHFGPIRSVPRRFSKFKFFIVEIFFLIRYFWVIFENYSMHMLSIHKKQFYRTLSIRGKDFIAHWAYAEGIFTYA